MQDKKAKLNPAICFTMLGHHLSVDIETIIDYYLYQNVSNYENAVCAIPLGQTAGQDSYSHDSLYRRNKKADFRIKRSRFWHDSAWFRTKSNGA